MPDPAELTARDTSWSDSDPSPSSIARSLGDWFGWAIVELAPDGILVTDETGNILFGNRELFRLFGYERHELIGRRIEYLMPERFRPGHLEHRHDFDAQPSTRPMAARADVRGLRSDGREIPVQISLSPVLTAHGVRTIAVIRAQTVQDDEERIVERERQLQQSEIVASTLVAFLGGVHSAVLSLAGLESSAVQETADVAHAVIGELEGVMGQARTSLMTLVPKLGE